MQGVAINLAGGSAGECTLHNPRTVKVVSILSKDLLTGLGENVNHCGFSGASPTRNNHKWSHGRGVAGFSRLHQIPTVFNGNVDHLNLISVQTLGTLVELLTGGWNHNPAVGNRLFDAGVVVVC